MKGSMKKKEEAKAEKEEGEDKKGIKKRSRC